MGDALRKVVKGERLRIPAAAYNAFIDTALDYQRRGQTLSGQVGTELRRCDVVKMKNDSALDCPRFGVLAIANTVIDPANNLVSFQNETALRGVVPQRTEHVGKFAIATEPIRAGKFGLAVVAGVFVARINVNASDHRHADIADGQLGFLESVPMGAAHILYKDSGTGEKWAVVRVGPAVAPGTFFAIQVSMDGGELGLCSR